MSPVSSSGFSASGSPSADLAGGLERVLKHEWGHMFGGAHVADPGSVMNRLLTGGKFDALNVQAIRLSKDRTFNGIDFSIPKDARRQAIEVYRELCDVNLRAPGKGVRASRG